MHDPVEMQLEQMLRSGHNKYQNLIITFADGTKFQFKGKINVFNRKQGVMGGKKTMEITITPETVGYIKEKKK
jgi:hypothetical protein